MRKPETDPEKMKEAGAKDNEINKVLKLWELLHSGIKLNHMGRIQTSFGDKSPLGLYRTLKRFFETKEVNEQNKKRADLALNILQKFAEYQNGYMEEDTKILAVDLITNIIHLFGEQDFNDVVTTAKDHYHAELNGED